MSLPAPEAGRLGKTLQLHFHNTLGGSHAPKNLRVSISRENRVFLNACEYNKLGSKHKNDTGCWSGKSDYFWKLHINK